MADSFIVSSREVPRMRGPARVRWSPPLLTSLVSVMGAGGSRGAPAYAEARVADTEAVGDLGVTSSLRGTPRPDGLASADPGRLMGTGALRFPDKDTQDAPGPARAGDDNRRAQSSRLRRKRDVREREMRGSSHAELWTSAPSSQAGRKSGSSGERALSREHQTANRQSLARLHSAERLGTGVARHAGDSAGHERAIRGIRARPPSVRPLHARFAAENAERHSSRAFGHALRGATSRVWRSVAGPRSRTRRAEADVPSAGSPTARQSGPGYEAQSGLSSSGHVRALPQSRAELPLADPWDALTRWERLELAR